LSWANWSRSSWSYLDNLSQSRTSILSYISVGDSKRTNTAVCLSRYLLMAWISFGSITFLCNWGIYLKLPTNHGGDCSWQTQSCHKDIKIQRWWKDECKSETTSLFIHDRQTYWFWGRNEMLLGSLE